MQMVLGLSILGPLSSNMVEHIKKLYYGTGSGHIYRDIPVVYQLVVYDPWAKTACLHFHIHIFKQLVFKFHAFNSVNKSSKKLLYGWFFVFVSNCVVGRRGNRANIMPQARTQ